MIKKSKGNFFYEVIIIVLTIFLIWAILYPGKVWKKQENLQKICRSRMEALQQFEYQYFNNYQTYTDSIPKLMENVLNDSTALSRLDSVLNWDMIITKDKLKNLVLQKNLPEDLNKLIMIKLEVGKPLLNLFIWDSLQYRLAYEFKQFISKPDSLRDDEIIDSSVKWNKLLSRGKILDILEDKAPSENIRLYSIRQYRRNKPLSETQYWNQYRSYFHEELKNTIKNTLRKDIWTGEEGKDRDKWEEVMRPQWIMQLDTLSTVKKDSIIEKQKTILWSKRKELIWKEDHNKLWKKEGDKWLEENSEVWKRILDKKWRLERKKKWLETKLTALPDSSQESFKAQKDSLWKTIVDSLKEKEYEQWLADNKNIVKTIKKELFESDTRLTWEENAYREWIANKEKNTEEFWQEIKDLMWKQEKDILWKNEEDKLEIRNFSLKKLDASVHWINILGKEKIVDIVNNLDLPNNEKLWMKIDNAVPKSKSVLYDLGVAALFSNTLLKSVRTCPVVKEDYLVSYVDTTIPPQFEIKCPIIDTTKTKKIMIINPVSKDTTYKKLNISFFEKVFGGRKIHNHGKVNHSKTNWEQKGL